MKRHLMLTAALLFAAPAFAQTTTMPPAQSQTPTVQGGSPGTANSGPASTGTVAPTGTGAESSSNNSAGSGNADQPSQAVPNTGRQGNPQGGG